MILKVQVDGLSGFRAQGGKTDFRKRNFFQKKNPSAPGLGTGPISVCFLGFGLFRCICAKYVLEENINKPCSRTKHKRKKNHK